MLVLLFQLFKVSQSVGRDLEIEKSYDQKREGRSEKEKSASRSALILRRRVRGFEDIEWRVVERISRARAAREAVRGERGWVGSRIERPRSRDANPPPSLFRIIDPAFAGVEVTDGAFATYS